MDHWFEEAADHLGKAYLRYSFTKGTAAEVDFIIDQFQIEPGAKVLDVGCGPGRHSIELAQRGYLVHGIDISTRFIEIASEAAKELGLGAATFERADARAMAYAGEFDVVICLCQGAFGMMVVNQDDEVVLGNIVSAAKPGGFVMVSAFNSYFSIRHHTDAEFNVQAGVSHERTTVKSESGLNKEISLWTGCYTPRELRLMARQAGLENVHIYGAEPGNYSRRPPSVDDPEHLLIARRAQ